VLASIPFFTGNSGKGLGTGGISGKSSAINNLFFI
jgi:hypothetical protein